MSRRCWHQRVAAVEGAGSGPGIVGVYGRTAGPSFHHQSVPSLDSWCSLLHWPSQPTTHHHARLHDVTSCSKFPNHTRSPLRGRESKHARPFGRDEADGVLRGSSLGPHFVFSVSSFSVTSSSDQHIFEASLLNPKPSPRPDTTPTKPPLLHHGERSPPQPSTVRRAVQVRVPPPRQKRPHRLRPHLRLHELRRPPYPQLVSPPPPPPPSPQLTPLPGPSVKTRPSPSSKPPTTAASTPGTRPTSTPTARPRPSSARPSATTPSRGTRSSS